MHFFRHRDHSHRNDDTRDHEHRGHRHRWHFGHRSHGDGDDMHSHEDVRGRHRRGRSGRMFDHGELRLVVLALIAERPRHGYEIIKEIEDRVAGTYSPSPGVIYPTLTMLEELGHATVAESEGKKHYTITADGTAYLDANKSAVDQALAHMQDGASAARGPRSPHRATNPRYRRGARCGCRHDRTQLSDRTSTLAHFNASALQRQADQLRAPR
jgi:DNA-binding PadR family transcriptional regulator